MDGRDQKMKIKELYLSGKAQNKKFYSLRIDEKIEKRIDRYSLLFHFITFLPFIIIFVNLFKFISIIRPLFVVLTFIVGLISSILLVFNSYINILLYKEFTKEEDEEIKKFFSEFETKSFIANAFINIVIIVNVFVIVLNVILKLI